MSTDVAELKALVKQLQNQPKSEVNPSFFITPLPLTHVSLISQVIIETLTALKKHARINESILRVSHPSLFR